MDWINRETPHVIGTSGRGGDPSLMTADGVLQGIRETVRHRLGVTNLAGVTVAVQGLGHVGAVLCEKLAAAGARLIVGDVDTPRVDAVVRACGAAPVAPDYIHRVRADVFAPCALGAVLNVRTIPELRCATVAGSANNQLAEARDGLDLHARGILYAPDYVVNAGGLISAAVGLTGEDPNGPVAQEKVAAIGRTLDEIYRRSQSDGLPPEILADRVAEERLDAARAAASRARPSGRIRSL
jgi:leucine dehydrogenase